MAYIEARWYRYSEWRRCIILCEIDTPDTSSWFHCVQDNGGHWSPRLGESMLGVEPAILPTVAFVALVFTDWMPFVTLSLQYQCIEKT